MASMSSAIRSVAKRSRTSAAPAPAEPRSQLRVAGERRRGCAASPSTSPDRREEAALTVGDDRGGAADPGRDDGALRGQRLDRDHRRALVRRGQQEGVEGGVPLPDPLLEADEAERVVTTPSSCASASVCCPVVAVADAGRAPRRRPDRRSDRSVRIRSSGRLIGVIRPAQPTTKVSSPTPISSRTRTRASLVRLAPGRELEAVRDDGEAFRRRDAEARRGRRAPRRSLR